LTTSGEDAQTVPRKYLGDWNGSLYVRFLILTNELPQIKDASGALASRFVLLALTESFYGKEDLGLFGKLALELPSIAQWALEGRDRLYKRGYFVQPASAEELTREFEDLGNPVGVFLKACTVIVPGAVISKKELFRQWAAWCVVHGEKYVGTDATFARNIRAVLPWIKDGRIGGRGEQDSSWKGIGLSTVIDESDPNFGR
jgi:putative DNA primase/helicase